MDRYRVAVEQPDMAQQLNIANSSRSLPAVPPSRRGTATSAGGASVLVQELSGKLAKQRKQLEELISQKAAEASTIKWYHVALCVLLNNLFALAVGFSGGSFFFGVGPFGSGSFEADFISATSLRVVSSGAQSAVLQTPGSGMQLTIRAGSAHTSSLVLGGPSAPGATERFSMGSGGALDFAIRQAGVPRLRILGYDNTTRTDIMLLPDAGGTLVVEGELSIGAEKLETRNSSLTLRSSWNHDVELRPAGSGIVLLEAGLATSGVLVVGNSSGGDPLLTVRPENDCLPEMPTPDCRNRSVVLGVENGAVVGVTVVGAAAVLEMLVIESGGLNVSDGNVLLGSADVLTNGNVHASGDVVLGSDYRDEISVHGGFTVADDDHGPVVEIDTVGNMMLTGSLTVEENMKLNGDVILGGSPTDRVTINAFTTEMNSLIATGNIVLGDDDDDTTTIYGALKTINDRGDTVLEIDPLTGNTLADGTLEVSGGSWFRGSVTLGDSLQDQIFAYGSTTVHGDVTMSKALNVVGDTHVTDLFASNVTLSSWLRSHDPNGEVRTPRNCP